MISFDQLELNSQLKETLKKLEFSTPTPIQAKVIPILLEGKRDCVGIASTGTGKTAAFALPLLHHLDVQKSYPQAIILCPTRELCLQIAREFERFATGLRGVKIAAIYGGSSMFKQISSLEQGAQIIVGTPGRVIDLIERRHLKLQNIHTMVLDEADEMLSMGFKEDIESILESAPKTHRTLLFTATFSRAIRQIADTMMQEPIHIEIEKKSIDLSSINYQYSLCAGEHKWVALRRYLDTSPDTHAIIFCRTRMETQSLSDKLVSYGYAAEPIHGDLSQDAREHAMRRFRTKITRLLVATDVAARGIDVQNLTHIFHYQIPEQSEVFVHRSGRTGRAGSSGISLTIACPSDMRLLHRIEKEQHIPFTLINIPSASEVKNTALQNLVERIKNQSEELVESAQSFHQAFNAVHKDHLIAYILNKEGIFKDSGSQPSEPEDINKSPRPMGSDRDSRGGGRGKFSRDRDYTPTRKYIPGGGSGGGYKKKNFFKDKDSAPGRFEAKRSSTGSKPFYKKTSSDKKYRD